MGTAEAAEVIPSGVYRIDLGGGWFYLGSSNDLNKRKRRHQGDLQRGKHCNQIAQRVFDKYGVFNFSVIGRYPIDRILAEEQILLDAYCHNPKCANIATVAGISMSGRNLSFEHRAALSAANMGKKRGPFTSEHRANLSASKIGKKHSDAARAAMSAAQIGNRHSDETRAKMSATRTGKKLTSKHRAAISAAKSLYYLRLREAAAAAL